MDNFAFVGVFTNKLSISPFTSGRSQTDWDVTALRYKNSKDTNIVHEIGLE
jgi:hypothetical protein